VTSSRDEVGAADRRTPRKATRLRLSGWRSLGCNVPRSCQSACLEFSRKLNDHLKASCDGGGLERFLASEYSTGSVESLFCPTGLPHDCPTGGIWGPLGSPISRDFSHFAARRLACARAHLMSTAHLPTTANDGFRTHGLTADRGHAESEKQMAPSRLANEITDGTTTSTMKNAPTNAAKRAPRGVTFIISLEHTSLVWRDGSVAPTGSGSLSLTSRDRSDATALPPRTHPSCRRFPQASCDWIGRLRLAPARQRDGKALRSVSGWSPMTSTGCCWSGPSPWCETCPPSHR